MNKLQILPQFERTVSGYTPPVPPTTESARSTGQGRLFPAETDGHRTRRQQTCSRSARCGRKQAGRSEQRTLSTRMLSAYRHLWPGLYSRSARTRRSAPMDKPAGRASVLNRDDIATVAGRTPGAGYGERGARQRGRAGDTSAYELPAGQVSFP
jgi:hypothetical protein